MANSVHKKHRRTPRASIAAAAVFSAVAAGGTVGVLTTDAQPVTHRPQYVDCYLDGPAIMDVPAAGRPWRFRFNCDPDLIFIDSLE